SLLVRPGQRHPFPCPERQTRGVAHCCQLLHPDFPAVAVLLCDRVQIAACTLISRSHSHTHSAPALWGEEREAVRVFCILASGVSENPLFMNFQKINNIGGWTVFAVALVTYW